MVNFIIYSESALGPTASNFTALLQWWNLSEPELIRSTKTEGGQGAGWWCGYDWYGYINAAARQARVFTQVHLPAKLQVKPVDGTVQSDSNFKDYISRTGD